MTNRKHRIAMKKISLRQWAFGALFSLSLFSYVYLHAMAVERTGLCPSAFATTTEQPTDEANPTEPRGYLLPDAKLVKQLLNITKIIVTKD
jgi:hypothetical protein